MESLTCIFVSISLSPLLPPPQKNYFTQTKLKKEKTIKRNTSEIFQHSIGITAIYIDVSLKGQANKLDGLKDVHRFHVLPFTILTLYVVHSFIVDGLVRNIFILIFYV